MIEAEKTPKRSMVRETKRRIGCNQKDFLLSLVMVCGPNFFIYFLYSHKLIKGGINPLFALRLYAHLLGPGKKQVDKQINTGLLNIPVSIYANIIRNP